MKRKIGRLMLSIAIVINAVIAIGVDVGTKTHIFNPTWPPHARFHGIVMLVTLFGNALVSLWLIWRRSAEPNVGIISASLLQLFFSGAFYFAALVPGSGVPAFEMKGLPQLFGLPMYPNMVQAFIVIVLTVLADWLCHSSTRSRNQGKIL